MKRSINIYRLFFAVLLVVLCAIACLCLADAPTPSTAFAESATESSKATLAYKEESTENVQYHPLERVDYFQPDNYTIENKVDSEHGHDGIMGKSAVRQTQKANMQARYQISFTGCFKLRNTYEISFYAKSENAASNFFVNVWYAGKDGKDKNDELPDVLDIEGEWKKFSFTFTATQNHVDKFTLYLDAKTMTGTDTFDAVYYDQFSVVLVDDGYAPIICGEQFSKSDWTSGVENGELTSFNGGDYPAALKLSTGSLISKIFEVPASGVFHLRFAVQKTAGASVAFTVKNAIGEEVDRVELVENFSHCELVTSDLSAHSFVYLQFDITGAGTDDYAVIGALEMVEHAHETSQNDTEYEFSNCQKTTPCKSCGFDLVTYFHDFKIEREPTCAGNGLKICKNVGCKYNATGIELPATGIHTYADMQCSLENEGTPLNCLVCGGGRFRLPAEHSLVYVSVSSGTHKLACRTCSYEGAEERHDTENITIARSPSTLEKGFAVLDCVDCAQKHGIDLPCIEEGSTAWTMTVEKEENCVETGVIRYTLNALTDIYVEYSTEAFGHDYEAIKRTPTCTEDGVSLHHECKTCGCVKETAAEIITLTAYGHELTEWDVEKEPTLDGDGLRKKYCIRCKLLIEEEIIPRLDEENYVKYALDDHDSEKGFYYYYENAEYGTYSVYIEGTNQDNNTIIIICVSAVLVIVGSVAAYCIVATKIRKKKGIE